MGTASNTSSDEAVGVDGSSACQALYDAATPEIFLNNAFRITALPIDATARDIAQHLAQKKLRAELGAPEKVLSPPFTRDAPPSIEQFKDAERKLRNPEQRIVDELFWFWPVALQGCKSDPALHALAAGDFGVAEQIWKTLESSPESGAAAIHNMAVRWHSTALSLERRWKFANADDKARELLMKCWNHAIKRWNQLATDNAFWAILAARVKALNDPRLSSVFLDSLRVALPDALRQINVSLMLTHVENDDLGLVAMHARLIDPIFGGADTNDFGTKVLSEAKKRIRSHVQRAQQHLATSPATAIDAARDLVTILAKYANLFSIANLSQKIGANDILDEGAEVCVQCAVISNKQTDDDVAFVDVLARVLEISRSAAMRERAQTNWEIGRRALLSVKLDPVYKLLAAMRDSNDRPRARLTSFRSDVEQLLSKALAELPAAEDARTAVSNTAAQVLRAISVDAWNKDKDGATALAAIKLAMKYSCGDEVQGSLYADYETLNRLTEEHRAIQRKKKVKVIGWVTAVVGLMIWIWVASDGRNAPTARSSTPAQSSSIPKRTENLNVEKTPTATSSTPAESSARPMRSGGSDNHAQRTYNVPSYSVPALERDSAAIEQQKRLAAQFEQKLLESKAAIEGQTTKADAIERQVGNLKVQIEREESYLDQRSSTAVVAFNGKIDRYNSAILQARAERNRANEMVNPYNRLVSSVNEQNRIVNQMVDAYNQKLRQVGH